MSSKKISIFWFRQDLRISDNPGFYNATKSKTVLPIYIFTNKKPKLGKASKFWLHYSLAKLNKTLNNKLSFYHGDPLKVLSKLTRKYDIEAIYWNRCYEPQNLKEEKKLKSYFAKTDIDCKDFNGSLLWEPWEILKDNDDHYKIFTSFYKKARKNFTPRLAVKTPRQPKLIKDKNSKNILSTAPLKKQIALKQIGEQGAKRKLNSFLKSGLKNYKIGRDFPAKNNTSKLSPHLHFGEISPIQIWETVKNYGITNNLEEDAEYFLRELAWRDFAYYTLYHFPKLPTDNLRPKFNKLAWKDNRKFLKAWQEGKTGFPLVDAGMRQLKQTGDMHNRVRMIAGSFLTKNLLIHWRRGRDWFWENLSDADLASNSFNWQWVAGSGLDSFPYFRIFNPTLQGEKFDPDGKYTLEFVPELSKLPKKFLFKPWQAPAHILKKSGIVLGKNYPKPIVDLKTSREKALKLYMGQAEKPA